MTRYVSDKDVEHLEDILTYLNFKVYKKPNLNRHDLIQTMSDFVDQLENNSVDICFVCIMSHGEDDDKLVTADNQTVKIDREILDRFRNDKCKNMIGKPKLFLFQACRGREEESAMVKTGSRSAVTDSPKNRNNTTSCCCQN